MPFQTRSVPPDGASLARASRRTSEWLVAGAAAVLSVLLYASTLDNPFVYDDFRLIVENPAIQTLSDIRTVMVRDITRPLVNLTYISDTAVWGTRPFGYHLTNVVLHALSVIAMFWVAFGAAEDWRATGGGRYGFSPSPRVVATATSLLVAAHPIMTQAVGYITGRSELLYGFFFLARVARRPAVDARRRLVARGHAVSLGVVDPRQGNRRHAARGPVVLRRLADPGRRREQGTTHQGPLCAARARRAALRSGAPGRARHA